MAKVKNRTFERLVFGQEDVEGEERERFEEAELLVATMFLFLR